MGLYWKCMIVFLIILNTLTATVIVKLTEKLEYIEFNIKDKSND